MPKAASFDPSTLKQEQVAVLGAMVGFGLEGYAHQVPRSLASALTQTRIPLKSLTVHDTLDRINLEGLTGEYTGMVSDDVRTGILDRVGLEKMDEPCVLPMSFNPVWPRSANPCPAGCRYLVSGSCKPASPPSV